MVFILALIARADVATRSRKLRPAPAQQAAAIMSDEESATRALIGDDLYSRMSQNVDEVIARHADDRCRSFPLSSGPDSSRGWKQLHKLLPGDPLWLKKEMDDGIECINVYSEGFLIGRLALTASDFVGEILDSRCLTGVYVAEQNCYGNSDIVALRVIIFYRQNVSVPDSRMPLLKGLLSLPGLSIKPDSARASMIKVSNTSDFGSYTIFQN
ncbi:MAG: hypothetical protein NC097_02575 [Clostridium sp.]|nr:hypothetical protein [Prevotella sp.]MCM1428661.1 hypothetical protein [Clostridium sp.]MCM1475790.1 hypothetical protein [Muribaculaceae bacterium]